MGEIDFVVLRGPDADWALDHITNRSYYILVFAFGGQVSYKFDGEQHLVGEGDVLFFRKGQIHSAAASKEDPWTFCSAAFDLVHLSDESRAALPHAV